MAPPRRDGAEPDSMDGAGGAPPPPTAAANPIDAVGGTCCPVLFGLFVGWLIVVDSASC